MAKTYVLILTVMLYFFIVFSSIPLVLGQYCDSDADCCDAWDTDNGDWPSIPGVCYRERDRCNLRINECRNTPTITTFPDACVDSNTLRERYATGYPGFRCLYTDYNCDTYGPSGCTIRVIVNGAPPDPCPGSYCTYTDYYCAGAGTEADPSKCDSRAEDLDSQQSHCNTCEASPYSWNVNWRLFGEATGDAQAGDTECCGDDNNEIQIDGCSIGGTNAPESFTCSGTRILCCSTANDCADDGGCYPPISQGSAACRHDGVCVTGVWYDQDSNENRCNTCMGTGYWQLGGEASSAGDQCCGDDADEYKRTCVDSSAQGSCGSDTEACCSTNSKCVDQGGACRNSGRCIGPGTFGNSYCDAGSWEDPDEASGYCDSTCDITSGDDGIGWNIGGEIASNNCCGDDASEYMISETGGGTDLPSGYNDGATTCCDAGTDCAVSRGGSPDRCYASDQASTDAIPDMAWCCNTGQESCAVNTWYGGDEYTSACNAIVGSGNWNLGGEVDPTVCCGDDNNQYKRTCDDSSNQGSCGSDTEACCSADTDCVGGGGNCRDTGACYGTGVFGNSYCDGGTWENPDESSTYCVASCDVTTGDGGIGWNLGGETAASECCGDDASEYVINEAGGTDAPANYKDDTTSCCDADNDCAYSGYGYTDVCKASGQVSDPAIPDRAYCNSSGTWQGGDDAQAACNAIVGSGYWNLGGETAASVCCGDDNNEYRTTETAGADSPSTDYNNGITTCCDASNDCTYNDVCTASGGTSAPAIPNKAYCNAGTWEGGDARSAACLAIAGPVRWNIGGEIAATVCCGDDSGEYNRSRKCDGYACTDSQSDDACCDQANDCVWQSVCYANGADHPSVTGSTCVSGVWSDTAAPTTTINPNGGDFRGQTDVDFTLTCTDTGGSNCDKNYYQIINDTDSCGTPPTDFTEGASGTLTCPFGQTCDQRICFYSTDLAGNTESVKQSSVFQFGIHPCMNKQCGEDCLVIAGICDGDWGNCYTDGGCLLDCSVPAVSPPDERRWVNSNCGRTGSYKCANDSVCSNSYTSCTPGGSSREVNGTWSSYAQPSGSYKLGDSFQITINGISNNPSGFTILTECKVDKSNGDAIYFNNWGSGNLVFSYAIQAADPEGIWTLDYCGLWSDFLGNEGWELSLNQTDFDFTVDMSSPVVTINSPSDGSLHNSNFLVNATATDTWSNIDSVVYRWESGTNGPWTPMARTTGTDFFTANFDISGLADGTYTIRVKANDTLGHEANATVDVTIDVTPPSITITIPTPDTWYTSDFTVTATVIDSIMGVDSVFYRWENSTGPGQWVLMTDNDPTWTSPFSITSVKDGLYTFRVRAIDNLGNENNESASNVGIDDELPASNVLPLPSFITDVRFNISWTGSDNESGIDCYTIQYRYNDTLSLTDWADLSVNGDTCTTQTTTEFDAEATVGAPPNRYTFYFRSIATDIAGNQEIKTTNDTKIMIFIPVLTNVYAVDTLSGFTIPNEGKTSADRIITIIAENRTPSVGILNFTLTYYNHTPGSDPMTGGITSDTRNNVYSINLTAGPYPRRTQISYWVYGERGLQDEWNPPQPYYYTFTMYDHPLANFIPKGVLHIRLGRSDIIGIEVRNIQATFDRVYLELDSEYARFVENDQQDINVSLNPQEEKIVYVRLFPSGTEGYVLNLDAQSLIADPTLDDSDNLGIIVFMPADFPGLSWFAICLLLIFSVLIYLKLVSKR